MSEIWRDIKGYEGLYQVSNLGRVKSLDRYVRCKHNSKAHIKGKIKAISKNRYGYCMVGLAKENTYKGFCVHRLVAQAFIPNPQNKREINHIDCNKENNIVKNLEWCSRKENMQHASKNNRLHPNIVNNRPIIRSDGKVFVSLHEAARQMNHPGGYRNIFQCARGERKSAYGYKWKYYDDQKGGIKQ
ncbi:MAG: NUMOD4 motif-containing HNH endonuclease [Enterococcus sp.]|nr:NUMOD4 motif-containing HNH endonuclease [Enterococcus sp.]